MKETKGWQDEAASEKQIWFAMKLVNSKLEGESKEATLKVLNEKLTPKGEPLTKGYASRMIDKLIAMPKLEKAPSDEEVKSAASTATNTKQQITEGMWTIANEDGSVGEIYKVQKAVYGSGNLYGKRLQLVWAGTLTPLSKEELEAYSDPDVAADYKKGGKYEGQIKAKFMKETGIYRLLQNNANTRRLEKHEAAAFGQLYGICAMCARLLTDEQSIEQGYGPVCVKKL